MLFPKIVFYIVIFLIIIWYNIINADIVYCDSVIFALNTVTGVYSVYGYTGLYMPARDNLASPNWLSRILR